MCHFQMGYASGEYSYLRMGYASEEYMAIPKWGYASGEYSYLRMGYASEEYMTICVWHMLVTCTGRKKRCARERLFSE
jgi:hypothetical protein